MKGMKNINRKLVAMAILAFVGLGLSGCGPKICTCLEEADKENPDQEVMEKCRAVFADMDMEEVEAAVKDCGR
jgi:hypothetical protein